MLYESNEEAIDMGEKEQINILIRELEGDEWYSNIIYYLKNLTCPSHLVVHKRIYLILKDMRYCLTKYALGWRNTDGVILRCVNKQEPNNLILELHSGYCGGHFATCTMTYKHLREDYYWPTIFPTLTNISDPANHVIPFSGKQ
jgi:hypothetical protein